MMKGRASLKRHILLRLVALLCVLYRIGITNEPVTVEHYYIIYFSSIIALHAFTECLDLIGSLSIGGKFTLAAGFKSM
jgi:hypothetical protein